MSICQKCKRKNICVTYAYLLSRGIESPKECDDFIGEQTNEEWIKSASTEELAKIIFDSYLSGYIAKEPPLIDEGVKQAEKWLKEVHKE